MERQETDRELLPPFPSKWRNISIVIVIVSIIAPSFFAYNWIVYSIPVTISKLWVVFTDINGYVTRSVSGWAQSSQTLYAHIYCSYSNRIDWSTQQSGSGWEPYRSTIIGDANDKVGNYTVTLSIGMPRAMGTWGFDFELTDLDNPGLTNTSYVEVIVTGNGTFSLIFYPTYVGLKPNFQYSIDGFIFSPTSKHFMLHIHNSKSMPIFGPMVGSGPALVNVSVDGISSNQWDLGTGTNLGFRVTFTAGPLVYNGTWPVEFVAWNYDDGNDISSAIVTLHVGSSPVLNPLEIFGHAITFATFMLWIIVIVIVGCFLTIIGVYLLRARGKEPLKEEPPLPPPPPPPPVPEQVVKNWRSQFRCVWVKF